MIFNSLMCENFYHARFICLLLLQLQHFVYLLILAKKQYFYPVKTRK
jgi:hypothetical protein